MATSVALQPQLTAYGGSFYECPPPSTTGGRYGDRLAVAAAAATTTIPDPDRPTTLPRRGRSTVLAATPLARYPMPLVAPLSTGAINRASEAVTVDAYAIPRATGIGHANGRLTRYHPHVTAPAKQVRAVPLTPAGTAAAKQPRSSPPAPPPSPAAPTQATPAELSRFMSRHPSSENEEVTK